jgi:phage gp36-like protein
VGAKLTVYVETAPSADGPWQALASFPALSVVASKDQVFADCLRYNRVRWVLEGATPSATFVVSGAAHVLYAKIADVGVHALPPEAIKSVPLVEQAACCLSATDEADGYLGGGKKLPLTAWGDDLTMQVAQIAAFRIMKRRGFQPQGSDELIVKGRDDAISWLRGVGRGDIEPPGMVDSTPDTYDAGITVISAPRQCGWWP